MDEQPYINVSQRTVYGFRYKGEWADILVIHGARENTNWVSVVVHSSYGTYGYNWQNIGQTDWWVFLNGLDIDYCLGKMMKPDELREFDHDKTVKNMKQYILEHRRQDVISGNGAREAWNELDEIEWSTDDRMFLDRIYNIPVFADEYWEWPYYSISGSAQGFWDRVWRPWIMSVANTEKLRDAA